MYPGWARRQSPEARGGCRAGGRREWRTEKRWARGGTEAIRARGQRGAARVAVAGLSVGKLGLPRLGVVSAMYLGTASS
eukprot:4636103-Prymnesium_polylepis.1